jgi:myo-inositol 2-dehydrogenase/D-chiro-inositol 1-dehydrogenase
MTATPDKRITVGVAGLGVVARTVHLPLLERRGDLFEPVAMADLAGPTVDELGERYGVPPDRRHSDAWSLLGDGGFDAVLLLTSGSHGELAAEALRRGLPVFCEKPLAFTRGEANALPAAAPLMVGYMKQYDPAVARAARVLADLGGPAAVHAVDITVLHPSGESQLAFAHLPPPADAPRAEVAALHRHHADLLRAAVGDAPSAQTLYRILVTSVCHQLSLLRLFTGAPASVDHVSTWRASGAKSGAEPSVEVAGALPGGGRYAVRWLYLPDYPAYRETVTIHHARGSLELVFPSPYLLNAPTTLTVVDGDDGAERRSAHRSVAEAFERELVAFHALVTAGVAPLSGVDGGAEDIRTSQLIVRRFGELTGVPVGGEAAGA